MSDTTSIITDFDRNVERTPGEAHLHQALTDALNAGHLQGWRIYEQPHLNGDRPDFVMVHPKRGIIVIEVKDWNLTSPEVQKHQPSPAGQLKRYHDNILQLYSRSFLPLLENHGNEAWAVVETAVYFHNAKRNAGTSFTRQKATTDTTHVRVLDRLHTEAIRRGVMASSGLNTLKYADSKFAEGDLLEAIVTDLEGWLHPVEYTKDRHQPIALTEEQNNHARPAPTIHRRLKGVAGSGKTVVLATRAARLAEEGKRVLFLTFNITLLHYVRDFIRQQHQGRTSGAVNDRVVIRHFHDFLKWIAEKYDLELPSLRDTGPEERNRILTVEWCRVVMQHVSARKPASVDPDLIFDAVVIDEGQDFTREWVELTLHFLNGNDELLIAFDPVQNIYDRELVWLDSGGDVRGLGFFGPPAHLKTSHRLPDSMIRLSNEFARTYLDANDLESPALMGQDGLFDRQFIRIMWENVSNVSAEDLVQRTLATIDVLRNELNAHPNDICILVEREDLALPIIEALKTRGMKVTHVFDDRPDHEKLEDDFRYRRQMKWKFQPTDGRIKVCTVHSFKGWEAPFLIGVLDPPNDLTNETAFRRRAALVYVGLTRLKRRMDGSPSVFALANGDLRFNDVENMIDAVD